MKRACKNDSVSASFIGSTTLGLQQGQRTTKQCPVPAQKWINCGYTFELNTFCSYLYIGSDPVYDVQSFQEYMLR